MESMPDEVQFLPDSKKREPVRVLMEIHLETLLLLCTERPARDHLRAKNVYPILRQLHLTLMDNAADEPSADLVDRIVQMLQRDEANEGVMVVQ
jgi:hypothetical protein